MVIFMVILIVISWLFHGGFVDDLMVYIYYIHNGICHQLAEISFEVIENHHFEKLNHRTKWVMVFHSYAGLQE